MKRLIDYNFRSLESLFEEGSVLEYNVKVTYTKKVVIHKRFNLNQIESDKIISSNDILNEYS